MSDRPAIQRLTIQGDGSNMAVLRGESLRKDGKGLSVRQLL